MESRGELAVSKTHVRTFSHYVQFAALAGLAGLLSQPAAADHTPDPAGVALVGSLQSELGCPGDWQPDCAATELVFDGSKWTGTFAVPTSATPAGSGV